MCTMRTWPHLESSAISLPPLISFPNLSNLYGTNKEIQRRRTTPYGSFSVTLQPLPPPPPPLTFTATFSSMADTHSRFPFDFIFFGRSADAERDCLDRSFTEIVIVRHGETEWNAEKRIQGHLDIDLNDVGRQQAVAVAERLSGESKISAIYSSDLKRALETAETIASRCGGLQVIQDPNLRERHLGDLQGIVYGAAPTVKTKAYEALQSRGRDVEIPGGGESLNQLYKRCTDSLQTIGSKHRGERVVVVTHGGVIRALHQRASSGKGHRAGRILNVSVNVLHLSDPDKWVIKSWGDVSHLDGAAYLDSGFGGDRTSG
ncbi:hypothetical protein SSX86_025160 [Deinandra increscens subsp. villosa]|uniref:Phosphoglycerate mutase n=1 Tax=Deinandra increscens subsp. villosa TaxID=3103831 RepID=A0AAP0CIQ0_9ASTR